MREASAQPRKEVVPDKPRQQLVRHKAKPPVVKAKADRSGAVIVEGIGIAVSSEAIQQQMRKEGMTGDAVSWLAPEGQCPHCDKRRTALQATMRKRRAKNGAKE